jgi:signal transduction histidine kinase
MLETVSLLAPLNGLGASRAPVGRRRVRPDRWPAPAFTPHDLFVATLAHELRQPLSTMLAAVEVVRVAPDTESARRAADVMRRQLDQMSRLVEDLVDAARWAHGKVALHRRRVDLSTVIAEAAAEAEAAAAQRGQMLVVPGEQTPIWVDGDRQRLLQVVSNLLRNAVKYTQCGGRITVVAERRPRTVSLHVIDNGRGIALDALPHVFELFSQMRPKEGTGLGIGLSIVREIVALHGGSIEARSQGASQGSEFIVELPLAEDQG